MNSIFRDELFTDKNLQALSCRRKGPADREGQRAEVHREGPQDTQDKSEVRKGIVVGVSFMSRTKIALLISYGSSLIGTNRIHQY